MVEALLDPVAATPAAAVAAHPAQEATATVHQDPVVAISVVTVAALPAQEVVAAAIPAVAAVALPAQGVAGVHLLPLVQETVKEPAEEVLLL
ncbi:hypothetical protein D3C87_1982260 [compost metagenome]